MAPVEGIWGVPTATIDWCEENYRITPFIAEFWNTISNVFFIIPSIFMCCVAVMQRHEDRYIWCHFSVFTVGFGSWCFHMTLLYSMQLLDELPMIYGSAFLVYSNIEVTSPLNHKNRYLQCALVIFSVVVTAFYLFSKHIIFFQVSYGVMVALTIFASLRVLLYHQVNMKLYLASFVTYMGGFILWNLDQQFCGQLRFFRKDFMGVFSPLLELHAWWHVLAGTGTYLSIMFSAHSRYLYLGKKPEIKYWMGVWPYVSLPNGHDKEQ